jgi:protocatechuate 3,4-dioxygenase beta subunit
MPLEIAMPPRLLNRRHAAAALLAVPAVWRGAAAQPLAPRRVTPAQTEGPFYPVRLPQDSDFDLLHNGKLSYSHGQAAWVEGNVMDVQSRPLTGAQVEIWQCDESGHYHHPADGDRADPAFQGFGRVTLGRDGQYRFHTIRPVPYGGRTPHIHVKVRLGSQELLTTQLYVSGEPRNERDFVWRHLAPEDRELVTVPFTRDGADWHANFPIVVNA